jgi:D-alanine-D-alanine ligase
MSLFPGRRVGVLMGGWSSEREISLSSGRNVLAALQRLGIDAVGIDVGRDFPDRIRDARIDIAFIILHGKPGEDGTIQGFLELLGIPYTGSGVEASAIGIDKIVSKRLFEADGIPTPAWVALQAADDLPARLALARERLGLPVIIKPRYEGSSVGMEIIRSPDRLEPAARATLEKFGDLLIEKFIPGMIATVGILDEQPLPILELVPRRREFYDYKAKYTAGETEFILPARLAPAVAAEVQSLALKCHRTLNCRGFSRVDAVIEDNERPLFLEVNTLPGLTDISDLPAAAAHVGISFDQLVLRILESALWNPPRQRRSATASS